tara:strand:- start:12 stop:251 length:240 start_codon:yes stop_codon:yes gene_type:complete
MSMLTTKTGKEIARLMHSMLAAQIMHNGETSNTNKCYWLANEYRAIIALNEVHGIPLSSYQSAKQGLEMDHLANASLSD